MTSILRAYGKVLLLILSMEIKIFSPDGEISFPLCCYVGLCNENQWIELSELPSQVEIVASFVGIQGNTNKIQNAKC